MPYIKPNENYQLLGTSIKLSKRKVYRATWATKQPDWKNRGSVFAGEVLLDKENYRVVKRRRPANSYRVGFLRRIGLKNTKGDL